MLNLKTLKRAMHTESDVLFFYPTQKNKDEITLLSIHFTLENGKEEYLVTNLMPETSRITIQNIIFSLLGNREQVL